MSVAQSARITLQLAVTGDPTVRIDESLEITSAGVPAQITEVLVPGAGGRTHVLHAAPVP